MNACRESAGKALCSMDVGGELFAHTPTTLSLGKKPSISIGVGPRGGLDVVAKR